MSSNTVIDVDHDDEDQKVSKKREDPLPAQKGFRGANRDPLPAVKRLPASLDKRDPLEFTVIIFGASILSFNAGFVNAICILTHAYGVTHVTGSSTVLGISLALADFDKTAVLLCLIFNYCAGSCFVGIFLQSTTFSLGEEYGKIFIFGSLVWLAAFLSQWFQPASFVSMYFCAFGSGLQNALTCNYSGNILRTTHMTGTITDIGVVIGRLIQGKEGEFWKLYLLLPIYVSFVLGSLIGAEMHEHLGEICLLFSFFFFLTVGVTYSVIVGRKYHLSCWTVLVGAYSKSQVDLQNQIRFVTKMFSNRK